jgi:adenylosuccinate synthase
MKEGETALLPHDLSDISEPVYVEKKGWKCDVSKVTNAAEMPKELSDYIAFIEKETGVPVTIVSLGPDRKQILFRKP